MNAIRWAKGRGKDPAATWKVGELAKRTGLSVRTLHYYEEIGLLAPSARTGSGHRLYAAGDIVRLQQIKSLRQLGFSLDDIRGVLSRRDFSPQRVIEQHLTRLREQIKLQHRLCKRLERIAAGIRSTGTVSVEDFLKTIEVMNMVEKYYTPDQMKELRERGLKLGENRIREVEAEWPQLIAQVRAEMDKGTDPTSEPVLRLAKRWMALVQEFTGGNREIEKSASTMYRQDPSVAARNGLDPKLFDYVSRATAGLKTK